QAQYCSVSKTIFEVEENTNVTKPLVDIHVPEGQEVTLGPLSTPFAFRIQGHQLFLNVTPDYEENSLLEAQLLCQSGGTLVTQLRVFVSVLDVNDNAPIFPFTTKEIRVEEDTKVNSTVIPETQLQAEDLDKGDTLFYTLQEVTAGASDYFSLVSVNRPALRLDQCLDFYERPNMAFRLLARPSPLVLRPGPIYAEDGDRGINQPIIYSIFSGNVNGTFVIHPNLGNLTMARSVPSPMTLRLLVKGQQADLARYSVTQVTVEAVAAAGSPPRFPQSLYRGTVVLGAGAGVVVKDAAAPSQPLRIQAQDLEFSDLNSAITYRITNHSHFRMEGEVVLTTTTLAQAGAFYAEGVGLKDVPGATTVIEIQVSEQEPPSTGGGPLEDRRFSVVDMAALGGVLGALLLLALLGLAVLVHKHYGPRLKCCSGKAPEPEPEGFDNQTFLPDHKDNWAPVPSPTHDPKPAEAPMPAEPAPPGPASPGGAPESPAAARASGSPTAVRSILTKERRPEGGYKAVWFGEDIGAEADVVVLNAPTLDVDGASDSGSGDEGEGAGRGGGPHDAPGGDDSYI
uniref:Cadherin related family member 5 n=1 Tax=Nomascus leucogenys TaxID=61853 RepID=A0A2I3HEX3_NOMLE